MQLMSKDMQEANAFREGTEGDPADDDGVSR
jgi:hypothetical protein